MRKASATIISLPKEARPREKIIKHGVNKLSDRELLIALIGRGIGGESVMVTAERLWARFRSLKKISSASVNELSEIRGIGQAKAAQIKVAFELGKRIEINSRGPEPFVKWAGGKSQLLEQYASLFPLHYNKYHEPFLGGGAVFFYLKPKKAILTDLNQDLIEVYRTIKSDVVRLIDVLKKYQGSHNKTLFLELREKYNNNTLSKIERAAAFIYLNKTGFNGLYRVNSRGGFNVPYGNHKNPLIFDEGNLLAVSKLLKNVQFHTTSFETVLDRAERGDFIYLDPPYYPLTSTSKFTNYTKDVFLKEQQEKLADVFCKLDAKGCKVMLSNSDTEFIKNLYKNYRIEKVKANRFINCNGEKRGTVTELVILNY